MNNKIYTIPLLCFILFAYFLVLYLIFSFSRVIDFTPFYTSTKALIYNLNPYPMSKTMPANLNPPFFLCLFYPFALLNYRVALIIWALLSFCLGLIAVRYAFFYSFSENFRKKYNLLLYTLYFAFFPVVMDLSIVQIGSFLFFFIMVGYHFYCQKKDNLAGFFWGFIVAVKLFPALLFFMVLKQGRDRVFLVMLTTFLLACLLPLLLYGPLIYDEYFSMLSAVFWYGDSWNASIYGFMFRLILDLTRPGQSLLPIEGLYFSLFLIVLVGYLKGMGPKDLGTKPTQINHQPFCLTLTMMILLSPFGWLYYFPLLIFPLILTGLAGFEGKTKTLIPLILWVICFFFINFPQGYVLGSKMQNVAEKLGIYSFYFYGLVLLTILVIFHRKMPGSNEINFAEIKQNEKKALMIRILVFILLFGFIVPFNSFLMRISIGGQSGFNTNDLEKLLREEALK